MKSNMLTMTLSLTLISGILGGLLGWIHDLTKEPIAQAEEQATRNALGEVLPILKTESNLHPEEIKLPADNRPVILYPATKDGKFMGAAVETWTLDGFSGEIRVMVGFDAERRITGYKVLQSAETPGLGAKADEWFRSDDAPDANTGASIKNTKSILGTAEALSVSKDGGQIDGITAATITSRAFLSAVNRAREALNIYCDKFK